MFARTYLQAGITAAVLIGATSLAGAQEPLTRRINFTFSEPVALPNLTLPAGRYSFEIPNTTLGRHIVQIYNAETQQRLATLLTIPAQRPDVPENAEVQFMETAANVPAPVKIWWYPGTRTGWEVVYPREQAMRLAQSAREPVLTTAENVSSDDMADASLVRIDASGRATPVEADGPENRAAAGAGAGPQARSDANAGQMAQNQGPAGSAAAPQPAGNAAARQGSSVGSPAPVSQSASAQPARTTLPQTAGVLPIVFATGMLTFVGGLAVRRWRRGRS